MEMGRREAYLHGGENLFCVFIIYFFHNDTLCCALVWSVGCKMITERKSTIWLRFSPFCTASAE